MDKYFLAYDKNGESRGLVVGEVQSRTGGTGESVSGKKLEEVDLRPMDGSPSIRVMVEQELI